MLVMPGDLVLGDGDGVIVIPGALAEQVAHDALREGVPEARSG